MVKTSTVLAILLILSILLNLFAFFRAYTIGQDKQYYVDMTSELLSFLENNQAFCSAGSEEPLAVKNCILDLNRAYLKAPFNEFGFMQYDTYRNESGYLVVVNNGLGEFDSDTFVLEHNRELVSQGCVIPGNIGKGVTCKLFFDRTCEQGDILEVKYLDKIVYRKNC